MSRPDFTTRKEAMAHLIQVGGKPVWSGLKPGPSCIAYKNLVDKREIVIKDGGLLSYPARSLSKSETALIADLTQPEWEAFKAGYEAGQKDGVYESQEITLSPEEAKGFRSMLKPPLEDMDNT